MTEIQEIDVFVKPDGTVTIEVRGVKGGKCLAITEPVEKLLGGRVTERVLSDEFHENEAEQTQEDNVELTER